MSRSYDDSRMGEGPGPGDVPFGGAVQTAPEVDIETYQQRVIEGFEQYTGSDEIHRSDLLDLLEDLGYKVTSAELKEVVQHELGGGKDRDGKEIKVQSLFDLDDTMVVCMHYYNAGRQGLARSAATAERRSVETEIELHHYLWLVLSCNRRRNVTYTVVRPKLDFHLTPKKALVVGAAAVMVVMCLLVLSILTILWVQNINKDEQESAQRSAETIYSLVTSFEIRNNAPVIQITDDAKFLAAVIEANFAQEEQDDIDRLGFMASSVQAIAALQVDALRDEALNIFSGLDVLAGMAAAAVLSGTAPGTVYTTLVGPFLTTRFGGATDPWDYMVANVTASSAAAPLVLKTPAHSKCAIPFLCTYSNDPCATHTLSAPQVVKDAPLVTGDRGAYAAYFMPSLGLTVCAFKSSTGSATADRAQMAAIFPIIADILMDNGLEVTANLVQVPGGAAGNIRHLTPLRTAKPITVSCQDSRCEEGNMKTAVVNTIANCSSYNALCYESTSISDVLDNSSVIVGCAAIPIGPPLITDMAAVMCRSRARLSKEMQSVTIEAIDRLNFRKLIDGLEVVVSATNATSGDFYPQVTKFLFEEGCYGFCYRSVQSGSGLRAGYLNKGYGGSIRPDYRPEPVFQGYMYVDNVDIVVAVEDDVVQVRGNVAKALMQLLHEANSVLDNLVLVPVSDQLTYTPMPTFNPSDPCPPGIDCFDRPGFGIVFRADCVDCVRAGPLGVVRPLISLPQCQLPCEQLSSNGVYHDAIYAGSTSVKSGKSYSGEDSLYAAMNIPKLSLGLVAHFYTEPRLRQAYSVFGTAAGVCVALIFVALLVFLLVSRRNLDSVENDWLTYKRQIHAQNTAFAAVVSEVLPAVYVPLLFASNSRIAERLHLCVSVYNFSNFQRYITDQDPDYTHDYTTYCFFVMSTVAQHFKLYKVQTFGDNFMVVGGVSRHLSGRDATIRRIAATQALVSDAVSSHAGGIHDDDDDDDIVSRCVQAAAVILQLFSYQYVHKPHNVSSLRKAVKLRQLQDVALLRVGVAAGPCSAMMTRHDGFPHFFVLGEPVAAALKLQQVSKSNTINVTREVKASLVRVGHEARYVFSKERTAMHKRLVIGGNQILKADVPVPRSVLSALKISRSTNRLWFTENGTLNPYTIGTNPAAASTQGLQSERSSTVSGLAYKIRR